MSFFLEIRCPDCKSKFVAEIHDIPKSLEKASGLTAKLSPAAIVEELPAFVAPLNVQDAVDVEVAEDSNSIGMLCVVAWYLKRSVNF